MSSNKPKFERKFVSNVMDLLDVKTILQLPSNPTMVSTQQIVKKAWQKPGTLISKKEMMLRTRDHEQYLNNKTKHVPVYLEEVYQSPHFDIDK